MTFPEYIKQLSIYPGTKENFDRIQNTSFDEVGDAYENAVMNGYKGTRQQYHKTEKEKQTFSKVGSMLEELVRDTTNELTEPIITQIDKNKEYVNETNNDTLQYINTEISSVDTKIKSVIADNKEQIQSINKSLDNISDNLAQTQESVDTLKTDVNIMESTLTDNIKIVSDKKSDKGHTHNEYALKTDIKVYDNDINTIKKELKKVDEVIQKERETTKAEIKKSIKNINIIGGGAGVLNQLNDVSKQAPSNNQILKYVSITGQRTPSNESGGGGDMTKAIYDTNNDGIVDNSSQLGGEAGSYYLNRSNHTGTQIASTISDFQTTVSANSDVSANTSARHTHSNKSILDNTTASFTTAEQTKVGHITVTQAVDLDAIETRVNDLDASVILRGSWDASSGSFPGGGTAQAGASYIVSVGGTVNSVTFNANDRIIAITDNASTSTFANNRFKADYTDQVLSVNGYTGAVSLVKGDIGLGNVDNTSDTTKNSATATLTNKTIALGSNTVSGTKAQFNTACTDGDFLYVGDLPTTAMRLTLSGTYASTSTFTFAGNAGDAEAIERCLFTCLNTGGSTRRIGYIKSASHTTGTVTATVVTDTDLASGDNTFKVTMDRKIEDYQYLVTIPGEQIADASNPQGMYYRSLVDTYLLPVNSFVRTASAGSGSACAWNIYKGSTNLFTSAQDMTTNTTFDEKRPNTNTVSAGDIVTVRVTSSAGATNKASDLQVQYFLVPQTLYTTAN